MIYKIKNIVLLICLTLFYNSIAQDKSVEQHNKIDFGCVHCPANIIAIRVGGLLQKGYYAELGIAKQEKNCGLWCSSMGYYTAIELTPTIQKDIYALKIGYEMNVWFLNVAIESKYLSNFSKNDFMITPKIGIGGSGILNFFYGYNISMSQSTFPEIGRHQLSIVVNIPITADKRRYRM